ncbi:MAG: Asp-tRNA(Asn)/Glu-tRNA(Gln) amidotransferase subunit GatC [Clostridia bacterium]|nr:Asp-tRNA(Asn)/Glu-tRNA(Gln) amidotransferase subunit GatC [Clostridia bacterium]
MDEKIKLVKHLADLGMLTFSDEEMQAMVNDMQDIIGLIDGIKDADVEGVTAKLNVVAFADLREDAAKPSMQREDILRNAAKQEKDSFVVAKVVE